MQLLASPRRSFTARSNNEKENATPTYGGFKNVGADVTLTFQKRRDQSLSRNVCRAPGTNRRRRIPKGFLFNLQQITGFASGSTFGWTLSDHKNWWTGSCR